MSTEEDVRVVRFDVARARALLAEREEFDRRRDPTRRGVWLTRPAVEIALRDACDEIARLEARIAELEGALREMTNIAYAPRRVATSLTRERKTNE